MTAPRPPRDPASRPSRKLVRFARHIDDDAPSVADVIERLGGDGIGILLIVLAVPALVPSPGIPLGAIFGAVLALVALQIAVGRGRLALPSFLGRRRLPGGFLRGAARWSARRMRPVENQLTERLAFLTGPYGTQLAGLAVFVMGIVIMLPIPFGNAPAAFAVIITAMALMMRDGLVLLFAYAVSVLALLAAVWLSIAGFDAASALFASS